MKHSQATWGHGHLWFQSVVVPSGLQLGIARKPSILEATLKCRFLYGTLGFFGRGFGILLALARAPLAAVGHTIASNLQSLLSWPSLNALLDDVCLHRSSQASKSSRVDSVSILFNHCSFQKSILLSWPSLNALLDDVFIIQAKPQQVLGLIRYPFFSTIVLFKNRSLLTFFLLVSWEKRDRGKEWEASPGKVSELFRPVSQLSRLGNRSLG